MPKKEQTITVSGYDKETILAICYTAFQQLEWDILHAGDNMLLANTIKSWDGHNYQVIASLTDNQLTVSSEMPEGESADAAGENQKNITAFIDVFESVKTLLSSSTLSENINRINALRQTTLQVVSEEEQAEEVETATNLAGSNLYATYAIIVINIVVFALMVFDGAGLVSPNGLIHIKWGSNYAPLTLSGDWWRLISCVFIHFGIIHLAMNMYTLYMAGAYLEPMLGKTKYVAAYLSTGVIASIVSLWWHSTPVNSAGASGAVFGLYGLFLALLTTNLIPKKVRKSLLQSIGIFVVYNLVYGLRGGIDNAAHVGGLVSGFVIGYGYALTIKKEKQGQQLKWVVPLIVLLTGAATYGYLQLNKTSVQERDKVRAEVNDAGYKDSDRFTAKYNEFVQLQDKALGIVNATTLSDADKRKR